MPTLAEIHAAIGGKLRGPGDVEIEGVASLEAAGPKDLAPVASKRYVERALESSAAALLVAEDLAPDKPHIAHEHPLYAFNRVIELLGLLKAPSPDVHPTAIVAVSATLGEEVSVGPYAVVEEGVTIGARTRVGSHAVIEEGARIGGDCLLEPGVVIGYGIEIGDRCVIGAHSVLGRPGFGWTDGPEGPVQLHHVGTVVLEDDVRIGGGCMIDRARFDETRIGRFTGLDNLCHVAHNCVVGKYNFLAAQVGLAGMTRTGDGCEFGGQSGVASQATVGAGVRLGAQTGLLQSIPPGGEYWGTPARPKREYLRALAHLYEFARNRKDRRSPEKKDA